MWTNEQHSFRRNVEFKKRQRKHAQFMQICTKLICFLCKLERGVELWDRFIPLTLVQPNMQRPTLT
jgi:hypothetical protein